MLKWRSFNDDGLRRAVGAAFQQRGIGPERLELRGPSPLMDAQGFTRQLESALIDLYDTLASRQEATAMNRKTILHVGPGHRQSGARLPAAFRTPDWQEVRLDIDPANEPDILGSMLDMAAVTSASVDAIYSSRNIEYVHAFEVPAVLREFHRVLKPEGFLVLTCPDLQAVWPTTG